MIKTITRAFFVTLFAAIVFAGVAVSSSPGLWEVAQGWAQSFTQTTPKPKIVLPKAWRDYLVHGPPSSSGRGANRSAAKSGNNKPEPAELPATDDAISVAVTEETMQNGTISHWDGDTKYLEPNIVTRKFLKVTSKADDIAIRSIEINRGNCDALTLGEPWKPVSLKFGESTSLWIVCDPIEAKISTDRGLYTFNW